MKPSSPAIATIRAADLRAECHARPGGVMQEFRLVFIPDSVTHPPRFTSLVITEEQCKVLAPDANWRLMEPAVIYDEGGQMIVCHKPEDGPAREACHVGWGLLQIWRTDAPSTEETAAPGEQISSSRAPVVYFDDVSEEYWCIGHHVEPWLFNAMVLDDVLENGDVDVWREDWKHGEVLHVWVEFDPEDEERFLIVPAPADGKETESLLKATRKKECLAPVCRCGALLGRCADCAATACVKPFCRHQNGCKCTSGSRRYVTADIEARR